MATYTANPCAFNVTGANSSLSVSRKLRVSPGVYSIALPTQSNFSTSARGFTITGKPALIWVSHHAYNQHSYLSHKEAAVGGLYSDYPGKLDPFIKAVLGIWRDEEELQTELLARGGLQTYNYRNYPEIEALLQRREEDNKDVEEVDEIMINMSLLGRLWKRDFKSKRRHNSIINAKFKNSVTKPEPDVSVVAHLKINRLSQIKFVVTLKE